MTGGPYVIFYSSRATFLT